ncbi:MAG: hypothetical protein PHU42_02575 [Patescibacteria group bacterium]|nr:hypothetical protein [Patescibacteria group bacterium]
MAPKKKGFTASIVDGPSFKWFIKWITECTEENLSEDYDKMVFGINQDLRILIQVTGIFDGKSKYSDFKIVGFIKDVVMGKNIPPTIKDIIVPNDEEASLDKLVVIFYNTQRRTGRLYGPLSSLSIETLLWRPVITGSIDTNLAPAPLEIIM